MCVLRNCTSLQCSLCRVDGIWAHMVCAFGAKGEVVVRTTGWISFAQGCALYGRPNGELYYSPGHRPGNASAKVSSLERAIQMALSNGRGISIWHVIPSAEMAVLIRPYRAHGHRRFEIPGRCSGLVCFTPLGRGMDAPTDWEADSQ